MACRWNSGLASLCGSRVARARLTVSSTAWRPRRSVSPPNSTSAGPAPCRPRTAAASTPAIMARPLTSSASRPSARPAATPGNSSPTVRSSAFVSPRPGSTWLM